MIDHRRCNKYIRQRVSDNPDLIRYGHSVRKADRPAYLMDLPFRQSTGHDVPNGVDKRGMSTTMRHVLCDVNSRRRTMIPLASAPDAPTMESYGKNDEVIP